MPEQALIIRIVVLFALFLGLSFVIFWVGLVWWVSHDAVARTKDRVILAASVALTAVLGPVGALLYMVIRPRYTIQEVHVESFEREMMLHAAATTICPHCSRMTQEDFIVCPYCGIGLKYPCPTCSKLVEHDWELCPYCGTQLVQLTRSMYLPQNLSQSIAPIIDHSSETNKPKPLSTQRHSTLLLRKIANALARGMRSGMKKLGNGLNYATKVLLRATTKTVSISRMVCRTAVLTTSQTMTRMQSNMMSDHKPQSAYRPHTPPASSDYLQHASPSNAPSQNQASTRVSSEKSATIAQPIAATASTVSFGSHKRKVVTKRGKSR
jgi:RNA polymerase subunit RPABC4/transcription elongation factor Spt4